MARVGQQRHRRKKLLEKVFMNNVVYGTAQASVHFLEFTLEQRGDHPFSPPPQTIKSFPALTLICV